MTTEVNSLGIMGNQGDGTHKPRGWTKRMDPRKSLKGREDMGRSTSKVQGREDLTEWAGCPCKRDIQL